MHLLGVREEAFLRLSDLLHDAAREGVELEGHLLGALRRALSLRVRNRSFVVEDLGLQSDGSLVVWDPLEVPTRLQAGLQASRGSLTAVAYISPPPQHGLDEGTRALFNGLYVNGMSCSVHPAYWTQPHVPLNPSAHGPRHGPIILPPSFIPVHEERMRMLVADDARREEEQLLQQ